MDKTYQAMALIIAQDHIQPPANMYKVLFDLMTNDLSGLMGDEWEITQVNEEKPHLKQLLSQLAFLISGGTIEHRHAKQILQEAWDTNHYAWDICWYLRDSKILDEKEGNELDKVILDVLKNNEKAVSDIKGGKNKAVGSLIGPIMRATGGKADPKLISKRILELINS